MRPALVLAAVCACGGAQSSQARSASGVAELVSDDVTGVARSTKEAFPVASYVTGLFRGPVPACWTQLVDAITAGYQLEVPGSSYFVIEGALPQAEVERCVVEALHDIMPVTTRRDGELVVFETGRTGPVYAAWRGGRIVAGTKPQVEAALRGSAKTRAAWRDRIASLPAGALAMWRGDHLMANLFGLPTKQYVLVLDQIDKQRPFFAGRVVVEYTRDGDAELAARRMEQGELHLKVKAPPELTAAFKRMTVKHHGKTVELAFDMNAFAGLDMAVLQALVDDLAAATPSSTDAPKPARATPPGSDESRC